MPPPFNLLGTERLSDYLSLGCIKGSEAEAWSVQELASHFLCSKWDKELVAEASVPAHAEQWINSVFSEVLDKAEWSGNVNHRKDFPWSVNNRSVITLKRKEADRTLWRVQPSLFYTHYVFFGESNLISMGKCIFWLQSLLNV